MTVNTKLGLGIGWRPEIAATIASLPDLDWVEVVSENLCPSHLPAELTELRARGIPALPHAVSLSLGGAEPLDTSRVEALAAVAAALDAPLVSDHVCFVRAGGLDSGHLLPVPRTRAALDVLVSNITLAQSITAVPFAVENIAALIEWPDAEFSEAQFLTELTGRTDCYLIIDLANLYANARNLGSDPERFLDDIPLERISYVHVAGGVEHGGTYHDTHTHPVPEPVLDLLTSLRHRHDPPGVLLERDGEYPPAAAIIAELASVRARL